MKINELTARPILDSRGAWTVEANITFADGTKAVASVPQGMSTGSSEARALPAAVAVNRVNHVIARKVRNRDFRTQELFDEFLVRLDGTTDKRRLGANAILAASIAFARATARSRRVPFWQHLRTLYGLPVQKSRDVTRPRLFMNLINGGVHGGSNLDIQEYVIIPKTRTFKEAAEMGAKIHEELGNLIARTKGTQATNLGDEGGFAPNFKDNVEPVHFLKLVVKKLGYMQRIDYGMDAAANEIKRLKQKQLIALYEKLIHDHPFIYLEDPFKENAFLSFAWLTMRFGEKVWITGDDLTTTNVRRMERAHAEGSVNAVIIKPNQIGSVTEALDAVRAARKYSWAVVASHRSGETDDDFIADFAYGVGADGFKLGAPARGERVAKYNRLLEIEAHEI